MSSNATHVKVAFSKVEWVRPPLQTRSQETLERILDAAEEVIAQRGFETATVSEIVRQAKSSVGAFYARFGDKDSLLGCLHQRFFDQAIATADAALDADRWEGASIAEIFAEAIPFLVHAVHQRQGLIRAFLVRSSCDPEFAESAGRVRTHVAERLAALLIARAGEINHDNPRLAIEFGLRVIFDTLDLRTLFCDTPGSLAATDLTTTGRELVRMYLNYLGVREPHWGSTEA